MRQTTFWMHREQQEYPVLRGRHGADAAVVGGGLTGLTTALWLSRAGLRVALVEAARLGSGASGCCAGVASVCGGLRYARLEKQRGARAAAAYARTQAAAFRALRGSGARAGAILRLAGCRCASGGGGRSGRRACWRARHRP